MASATACVVVIASMCVVLPKVWLLYKWLKGAPAVKVVAGAVVRMFLATQHAFLRVVSHLDLLFALLPSYLTLHG